MEHARKMVLIAPEAIERLKQSNTESGDITSHLDDDMKAALNSRLPDHEKWTLYQQVLQRYLHFKNQQRGPIQMSITEDLPATPNNDNIEEKRYEDVDDTTVIIDTLPKTYRSKAKLLLQRLMADKSVTWNKLGSVSINNVEIPNSNITDLIGDVLRPRKHSSPIGWQKFSIALKNINIPDELIGNPRRREFIRPPSSSISYKIYRHRQRRHNDEAETSISAVKNKWRKFRF